MKNNSINDYKYVVRLTMIMLLIASTWEPCRVDIQDTKVLTANHIQTFILLLWSWSIFSFSRCNFWAWWINCSLEQLHNSSSLIIFIVLYQWGMSKPEHKIYNSLEHSNNSIQCSPLNSDRWLWSLLSPFKANS